MNEDWAEEIVGRILYGSGSFGVGYFGSDEWDGTTPTAATWTVQNPSSASWTGQTVSTSTWTNQSPTSVTWTQQ